MKTCSRCKNDYPATTEYFYKQGDGLNCYCKPCRRKYNNKWGKTDKGKVNNLKHVLKTRAKEGSGVYGLFDGELCLYIGESRLLKRREWEHNQYMKKPHRLHKQLYYNLQQHPNIEFRILKKTKRHKEEEGYYIDIYKPLYNSLLVNKDI